MFLTRSFIPTDSHLSNENNSFTVFQDDSFCVILVKVHNRCLTTVIL